MLVRDLVMISVTRLYRILQKNFNRVVMPSNTHVYIYEFERIVVLASGDIITEIKKVVCLGLTTRPTDNVFCKWKIRQK